MSDKLLYLFTRKTGTYQKEFRSQESAWRVVGLKARPIASYQRSGDNFSDALSVKLFNVLLSYMRIKF
jgi:hypothetical protein